MKWRTASSVVECLHHNRTSAFRPRGSPQWPIRCVQPSVATLTSRGTAPRATWPEYNGGRGCPWSATRRVRAIRGAVAVREHGLLASSTVSGYIIHGCGLYQRYGVVMALGAPRCRGAFGVSRYGA